MLYLSDQCWFDIWKANAERGPITFRALHRHRPPMTLRHDAVSQTQTESRALPRRLRQ